MDDQAREVEMSRVSETKIHVSNTNATLVTESHSPSSVPETELKRSDIDEGVHKAKSKEREPRWLSG